MCSSGTAPQTLKRKPGQRRQKPNNKKKPSGTAPTPPPPRQGLTIAVSNEVGLGLVPENPLGRSYRDLLGRVNAVWADAADDAYLLVAGRGIALTKVGEPSELLP
jgi:adenosyl cobinamide kinase/adenosyl cobinamide phosphate guanylyltransferase